MVSSSTSCVDLLSFSLLCITPYPAILHGGSGVFQATEDSGSIEIHLDLCLLPFIDFVENFREFILEEPF